MKLFGDSSPDNLDFKQWVEMAKNDPELFENLRQKAINEVIEKAPEAQRQRLRSLSVARDYIGDETKISVGAGDLLETITRRWSSGHYVPVFVSEGTSKEKVAAIRRSHYLTNVYEEVLSGLGDGLVAYGWSFDERDQHVLDAIAASPPKRMAVSVFTGQPDVDQQAFCHHVLKAAGRSLKGTTVAFFDSQSTGCWNNP